MPETDWLAERFEEQRPRLRGVAYRMLGSLADADDAVQETWIRLARSDVDAVENLNAWLTTVVGRVSLNMLRSRRVRHEDSLDARLPDPVVGPPDVMSPEDDALVADSVGLALLVVLDTLGPAERLAFVLHDVFAIPFDEIAPMVDRSPAAARQLASRARRRIQETAASPDVGMSAQRAVVDAFFAAGHSGDFEALVAILHPDVVLRADFGAAAADSPSRVVGPAAIANGALLYANIGREPRPATVNGAAGAVIVADGQAVAVMAFTVVGGRVAAIDVLADPERLARLDLSFLGLDGDGAPRLAARPGAMTARTRRGRRNSRVCKSRPSAVPARKAGGVHVPVGLPGLAVIGGELLAPLGRRLGDVGPGEAAQDRLPVVHVWSLEDASAVGAERADHGVLVHPPDGAVDPVDRPCPRLGVERAQGEAAGRLVGQGELVDGDRAVEVGPRAPWRGERRPLAAVGERRGQPAVVDLPVADDEVEVAGDLGAGGVVGRVRSDVPSPWSS